MRRVLPPFLALALLAALPGGASAAATDQSYIVVYRGSVTDPGAVTTKHERADGNPRHGAGRRDGHSRVLIA